MEISEVVAAHALDRALEIERIQRNDNYTVDLDTVFKNAKKIAQHMTEQCEYANKRDEEVGRLQKTIDGLQDQIVEMAQGAN